MRHSRKGGGTAAGVAVLVFFCAICLVGCTGTQRDTVEAAPRPLSIMLRVRDGFRLEGNQYLEELERRLRLDITLETVSYSSYPERLEIMMLSGVMPDVVQLNWNGETTLHAWAAAGRIVPIRLEDAPNLTQNIPKAHLSIMKVMGDDSVYGVPGRTAGDYYGCLIRTDWLKALGLSAPRTLEEYRQVLEAFARNDPDNNGKDDTYGMISWRLSHLGGVFGGAFQMDSMWNTLHPDPAERKGEIVLREAQQGYMAFMDFAAELHGDGLLDPDSNSIQNAENKFILGKTGMVGTYSSNALELERQLQIHVPTAETAWILPAADREGRVWNFHSERYGYNGAGGLYGENAVFVITASADYDTALYFLDAMNSQEQILFANLGVPGVHYESYDENRLIVNRTEEQKRLAEQELFGVSDSYPGAPLFCRDPTRRKSSGSTITGARGRCSSPTRCRSAEAIPRYTTGFCWKIPSLPKTCATRNWPMWPAKSTGRPLSSTSGRAWQPAAR
ncbi:extracellular solute-binding protein [Ruminococcaceae bacterium OttesenSCG-928-L11]|nr:extracellular solute-binding protein [Ruminococcaceae bacterium OttesenSCG-928-L11]